MGFNTYPNNPFPPSTDRMDVDALEAEVSKLESGLTNVDVALSVPENSGKNVLPTTLDWLKAYNTVGTWDGNVYTKDGVTFTVATDSKGRISSITVNGTASGANTIIVLAAGQYDEWSGMILNGAPTNNSDYYIRIEKDGSPYTAYAVNIGGDTVISSEIVGNNIKIFIKVGQGKTANNAIFTPMIRDSRITDPTFAPYIPSVESRIEEVESVVTSYTLTPATDVTINRSSCVKVMNTVIVDAIITFGADKSASSALLYGIPAIGNTNIPIYAVDDNATARPVRLYNNGVFTSGAFTASEKIHIIGSYTLTN